MCYLNQLFWFLCSEYSFAVGGGFEAVEMVELGIKTNEVALVFTDFFDAKSVSGSEDNLFVLKTVDIGVGGFENWFYFDFHHHSLLI